MFPVQDATLRSRAVIPSFRPMFMAVRGSSRTFAEFAKGELKWRRKYTCPILCSSCSSVRKTRTLFVDTAYAPSIPYSRVAMNAATNAANCTSAGIATGVTPAGTGGKKSSIANESSHGRGCTFEPKCF